MKKIIAGFAGIGKTMFCEINSTNAVDLIVMPYKYSNFKELAIGDKEPESIKAHIDLQLNPFWRQDYIKVLKDLYYDNNTEIKYIVIPTDLSILDLLDESDIPYTVVIPDISLKSEYEERYENRGNTEDFISIFIGHWDMFISKLQSIKAEKIILQSGQYLSDVIAT